MPLYCFSEINQLAVLCYGQDSDSLSEQVYQFINILRQEIKPVCPIITTVVGNVVQRLSAVCQSFKTAGNLLKKVYGVSIGQVIDVSDAAQIAAEMIELGDPFGAGFQQKLQYASVEDVPMLVNEVLLSPEGNRFNSMLMHYYALVDILRMTVQQIVKATPALDAKDVATRLSDQHDIMAASSRTDSFRQAAVIAEMIQTIENGGTIENKLVISEEKGFDAATITQEDVDAYGLGE